MAKKKVAKKPGPRAKRGVNGNGSDGVVRTGAGGIPFIAGLTRLSEARGAPKLDVQRGSEFSEAAMTQFVESVVRGMATAGGGNLPSGPNAVGAEYAAATTHYLYSRKLNVGEYLRSVVVAAYFYTTDDSLIATVRLFEGVPANANFDNEGFLLGTVQFEDSDTHQVLEVPANVSAGRDWDTVGVRLALLDSTNRIINVAFDVIPRG